MRSVLRHMAAPSVALMAAVSPGAAEAAPCAFDRATLRFAGTPAEQARCLLKPISRFGRLGPAPVELPPTLRRLVGSAATIDRARLARLATAAGLPAESLTRSVSHARGGKASAPLARYFVVHDTSSPWFGDRPFPAPLDTDARVNDVSRFLGRDAVAHAFVDRTGRIVFGHDFSVPWRATKREKAIGGAAKGLFLHVENVQPRRRDPAGGPRNDAIAPDPGLSPAQYDGLALLYAIASARAGTWLVPAYHAALDDGIADGHDDPQNFDLQAFDQALSRVEAALHPPT